mmetsp:Transcript_136720/g.381021  ORF Transcript_136720/g.381021 Transcript_136720/m.381021 type:complete len:232 (+) Transcript_136720:2669-3364(+)
MRFARISSKVSSTLRSLPTEAKPPRRISYIWTVGVISRTFWKASQSSTMTSTRPARATTSSTQAAVRELRSAAACCRKCCTSSAAAASGSASTNACAMLLKRSWGVGARTLPARQAFRTAAAVPVAASASMTFFNLGSNGTTSGSATFFCFGAGEKRSSRRKTKPRTKNTKKDISTHMGAMPSTTVLKTSITAIAKIGGQAYVDLEQESGDGSGEVGCISRPVLHRVTRVC